MNRTNSQSTTGGLESLSARALVRLNYWCDQFELAWQQTGEVSIEAFLQSVPLDERQQVASELVLIDIEIRCTRGLSISTDDYTRIANDLPREWLETKIAARQSGPTIEPDELPPGYRLSDYTILDRLGAGGMGVVYRAEHTLMKRRVALKAIKHQNRLSRMAERRFEREVRAAAHLAHPNIVIAYDARRIDGWIYLVTELVEGENLDRLVKRQGPLTYQKALSITLQAARGLEYAHRQGIIHRDIKPANLLIDNLGQVKILDLGLARWLSEPGSEDIDHSALTSSFQLLGTAHYMAPEQARVAASADQRSDVYSLGCTLFYMLTGQAPYHGASSLDICMAHVNDPVPSSSDVNPVIPVAIDGLLKNWMAKEPLDRPQSMTQAIEQIETLIKPRARAVLPPGTTIKSHQSLSVLDEPAKSTLRTRRNVLLSSVGVAAAGAIAYSILGPSPAGAPSTPQSMGIADARAPGLRLKADGYLEVADFNMPVRDCMSIEALVTPSFNRGPTNIVTWTGPQSFVLFSGESTRWGLAYFDGERSRLILADEPSRRDAIQLVGVQWDGQQLQLQLNGRPIASQSIRYLLVPATPSLYIGGIPDGVIPADQGTRYFHGEICAVRIMQSKQPLKLAAAPEELTLSPTTLAFFDFSRAQLSAAQNRLTDLTGRWTGQMRWI